MFGWFKRKKPDVNKSVGSNTRDGKRRVCANCKNTYIEGDSYCRFCGAPMGKPDYIEEEFACIYGPPPVKRKHKCAKCGYTWSTEQMIDNERWCPKCGGPAPVSER